jgi:adenylylsulfate kinase
MLLSLGVHAYGLDGDNIRHRLNVDLGFSPEDRKENIRRVGEVAALFADACTITLTAFISPYRADRAQVRALVPKGRFIEVFVDTPLEVCEARDPKGLYRKARAGDIPQFTGISAPYEAPEDAEIRLQTSGRSIDESATEVVDWLRAQGFISG